MQLLCKSQSYVSQFQKDQGLDILNTMELNLATMWELHFLAKIKAHHLDMELENLILNGWFEI